EGEQSVPVFRQAGDGFLVLGAVFIGEHVDRRLGRRAGWRAVDFTKVCFHVGLDREGDLVQHIGGLMDPAPLMPGGGKDLLDCFPEAERPVADREVRGAISSPRSLMSMRSSRQLCALSRTPVWKPTSSFFPSGVAPISTSMHSALSSIRACR